MPKPDDKSFAIPKQLVWEAWRQVKANKVAAAVCSGPTADALGPSQASAATRTPPVVDGQDLGEFEADLGNNLYKIWNRMGSGSYVRLNTWRRWLNPIVAGRWMRYYGRHYNSTHSKSVTATARTRRAAGGRAGALAHLLGWIERVWNGDL